MPQVLAWECPRTEKLFKDKAVYLVHLKELARESIEQKAIDKYKAEKEAFFKNMRDTCTSTSDIEEFIKKHFKRFISNGYDRRFWFDKPKRIRGPKLEHITITAEWRNRIANTHSAPIGQAQNFRQDPTKPCNFPGFKGRITFGMDKDSPGFTSDMFEGTGIHTGTGGGGHKNVSYDLILWADDWPAMSEAHYEREVMKKLVAEGDDYKQYL